VFTVFHGSKKLKDYNQFGEDNLQYATSTGTPSWFTLHAKVTWQFKIQQQATFQLTVGIDNILDAYYRVFASGISAPGRNLQLAVRAYF
jgi:hemoglobin/transferrin/lactoferrin receptor protein